MPFCEYNKCNNVAKTDKIGLLRTWDSYHFRTASNHTQGIWLCTKHVKKLQKLLNVEMQLANQSERGE